MDDFTQGVKIITTKSTGRFLSSNLFSTNNIRIQFGGETTFGWNIIENEDGTIAIEDYISGKYVQAFEYTSGGNTVLGITLVTRNELEDKQAWYIEQVSGRDVRLKNKFYNKYITALNETNKVPPPEYADNFDYKYHAATDAQGKASLEDYIEQDNQIWRISPVTLAPIEGFTFPQIGFVPMQEKIIIFSKITQASNLDFTIIGPENLTGTMEFLGQYVEPNKGIDFVNYYYKINVTPLEQVGSYTISSNGFEDEFIIANDVYSTIRGEEGVVTFQDFIDGFWANNKIVEPHDLPETIASDNPDVAGVSTGRPFVEPTGNTVTVSSGWFDAHSRDMKMARESMNLFGVCLAALENIDEEDKQVLVDFIIYTANSTLSYQNADGSWPIGKVRRYDNSNLYSWVINKDTGNVAKCVRSLAISYQIIKDYDSILAQNILNACYNGWNYIQNHSNEDDFIGDWLDVSFTGTTIDIVGAGVEMYIATNDSLFKDYVDYMIANSEFRNGLWRYNLTDMYVKLSPSAFEELRKLSILTYQRYYAVASESIKAILQDNMISVIDHWNNRNSSPYNTNVRELSSFGRAQNFSDLSLTGLYIYDTIGYETARTLGTNHFNWVVGFNPLFESAIIRVGREASVYMFKQPFHTSAGALVPSIVIDTNANPIIPYMNFGAFQSSEATVISSSLVFPLFVMMNKVYSDIKIAMLELVKTADKESVKVNDIVTYTIEITNTGNVAATDIVFIDDIPDNTSFVEGSLILNGESIEGSPISPGVNIGNLSPGETSIVSFQVQVDKNPNQNIMDNIAVVGFSYTVDVNNPNGATGVYTSNRNIIIFEDNSCNCCCCCYCCNCRCNNNCNCSCK